MVSYLRWFKECIYLAWLVDLVICWKKRKIRGRIIGCNFRLVLLSCLGVGFVETALGARRTSKSQRAPVKGDDVHSISTGATRLCFNFWSNYLYNFYPRILPIVCPYSQTIIFVTKGICSTYDCQPVLCSAIQCLRMTKIRSIFIDKQTNYDTILLHFLNCKCGGEVLCKLLSSDR